ncbi:MAG TPA: insulinase family protein, partial [Gemmatimonadetes bacterium]|nr:insulinase family protein [Gemmatimonadota bacterium]
GNLLYEAHLRAAFKVHPYREPVVGHMQDINNLTRRDIRSHYEKYYGPENAVVAVVGNIEAELVQQWANQYFGHLPRGRSEGTAAHAEPDQKKERRVSVIFQAEPQLRIGWHTVPTAHPDSPALMVLAALLTGNRSSRLFQRLVVQDQTASNVSSSLGPGDLFPRLFSIGVSIQSSAKAEDIEQAVYDELGILAQKPPSEQEIQKIRNQISAGQIRGLASNFGLALQLAHSASLFGDWRYTFELSQELKNVEPEMISQVIKKFFNPNNRTVATLVPTNSCVR